MNHRPSRIAILVCVLLFASACGRQGSDSGSTLTSRGPVELAFIQAASAQQIPLKLLLAIAFNESNLNPVPATALYNADLTIGSSVAESAFGMPPAQFGLEAGSDQYSFTQQIAAYAEFIRGELNRRDLAFDAHLEDSDELYDWIWFIAKFHRNGTDNRQNVQTVFALEIIAILNKGFVWQSADGSEVITLPPEQTPITSDSFSTQIQNNLTLDTRSSEIFSVDYMQLTYNPADGRRNVPKKIRVIHCPFSLSACLNLQTQTLDQLEARLGTHYVIPTDKSVIEKPIKILQHRVPVTLTDKLGRTEFVDDAVVVMLVGNSGHYLAGDRVRSQPLWLSRYQLRTLGEIVQGICSLMREEDPLIDEASCLVPGGDSGIQFTSQGSSQTYRWGDISDFNEDIFYTYIRDPNQLKNEPTFTFARNPAIYEAGEIIQFQLAVNRGARTVELELMERCEGNKAVWTTLERRFIRDTAQLPFETVLYQPGTNGNGSHFLRALVYGEDGELSSWGSAQLILRNYDESFPTYADLESCL